MIERVLTLVVAVAAMAILGVWYLNARDLKSAAVLSRGATFSPEQAVAAERLFDRAQRLSPDTSPALGQVFVLLRSGQRGRAAAKLHRLAKDEPQNLLIWRYLAVSDPAAAKDAQARMRRLAPPVR